MTKRIHAMPNRRRVVKAGLAIAAANVIGRPMIARAADTIKVGILQPLSGGLEALGEQGYQGAKLAIDEANDNGGILGRKIEDIRTDDKTDPKTAVEKTLELIQRGHVNAICGPVTSSARDAIQPIVERLKTPLLYATDYEGGVCSRYMSCYSALPEQWVDPLIPYVRQNYGDSFYLIGSNFSWPQRMFQHVRPAVDKAGGRVVGEEFVPFGVKDFTSNFRKIEESGANVLVNNVVGADAITLVKQFTAAGLKSKIRIVFFGFSENYIAGLTNPESDGIVTISNFTSSLDKPEAKAFVKNVRDRYGQNTIVSNTTDAHYGIMRFYFNGIKRAGTDEADKVLAAMVDQTLLSGNGEVYLRASDRHVDLNVIISEAKDGALALKKTWVAFPHPTSAKRLSQLQSPTKQTELTPLLRLCGVIKNFGGVVALDGVDFSIEPGSLTCIIGPNGCGKTTLFNVITGAFRPTAGSIRYADEDITGLPSNQIARRGIARKFQVPGIYPSLTVAQNIEVAAVARSSLAQQLRDSSGGLALRQSLELTHLRGKALIPAAELAHGEKQWLEVGMLMACDPDLILLDEPTAGMTIAETQSTADLILKINRESGKTILVIEHDMHFVRRLACRVIVMMRGRVFRDGSYEEAQADPEVRRAYLGEVEAC